MAVLSNYLLPTPGRQGGRLSFPRIRPNRSPFPPFRTNRGPSRYLQSTVDPSGISNQLNPTQSQALATQLASNQNASAAQGQASAALTSPYAASDASTFDPILSQIQAISTKSVDEAHSNARNLRQRAAIESGDPELLRALGFDANTITAATQNPESLMASLAREYKQRQNDVAEANSAENTIYGGHYVNDLRDLSENRASAQGQIGSKLRDLLSGIDRNVLDVENQAREQELQDQIQRASEATYAKQLTDLMNASGAGGGGSFGGGGGTPIPATDGGSGTTGTGNATPPIFPTREAPWDFSSNPLLGNRLISHLAASTSPLTAPPIAPVEDPNTAIRLLMHLASTRRPLRSRGLIQ